MEAETSTLKIVPYHAGSPARKRVRRSHGEEGHFPVTKVKNACIACRERKTRCSGHLPCIRCQQHSITCQFMPTASSRPVEIGTSSASTVSTVTGSSGHDDSAPPSARLLPALSDSSAHQNGFEEPTQEDQYGHFHGSASGIAFLHFAKHRLASLPSMALNFSDYPLMDSGKFPPVLPPKQIADVLVRHFFEFALLTSRFVHRPSFTTMYESLYSGQKWSQSPDDLALIYMVLATGSHYSQDDGAYSGYTASVRFYDMARKELQTEASKITLSSLQARLLVIHYLLNHSRMHEAWSSFGFIVRQAQALRLHRAMPTPPQNYIDYEYRKRLFWSVYTHDRVLSSIFGRPFALHDDDIDQEECVLADDDDITAHGCRVTEGGAFSSAAAFIHYLHVARILGRVLREFYGPVRKRHTLHSMHEVAAELEVSLQCWQDNLPAYLNYVSLPASAMSTMAQRQMCTLKLAFAHTSLLLYRPFLLYSVTANTRIPQQLSPWLKHCHDKSREAANVVVAECRDLFQRGHFSRIFWLVNFVQFAAIGTLYMYSYLWPAAIDVRETADEALNQFPVGVEGDLVGQRYLEILKELREVTRLSSAAPSDPPSTSEELGPFEAVPVFDDAWMSYGDPWGHTFLDASMGGEYIGE